MLLSLAARARAADSDDTALAGAKALFREGVVLLDAGDHAAALDRFTRSRALVPSAHNLVNAAICLQRLGRDDEALELYDDVVARFAGELAEGDRESLSAVAADLARQVGRLELSGDIEGELEVDGRKRAILPLARPLPLLPGERLVRVVAAGRVLLEQQVQLLPGEMTVLTLPIAPIVERPVPVPERVAPVAERTARPPPSQHPTPPPWNVAAGLDGGPVFAPRLNGTADSVCPDDCAGGSELWGGRARLSFAARHVSGFGAEARIGYLTLHQRFARSLLDGAATYAIVQATTVRGPFVEVLGSFDLRVVGGTYLRAGLGFGVAPFIQSIAVSGLAWTDGPASTLDEDEATGIDDVAPLGALALGGVQRVGPWSLSLGVEAWFLLTLGRRRGPTLSAQPSCAAETSGACPPLVRSLNGERVRGRTWLLAPEVGLGYTF